MIIQSDNFNLQQIADSGQCFRMNNIGKNKYGLVAFGKYLELIQIATNTIQLNCTEQEWQEIWKDYFDMGYDYKGLVENLVNGDDSFISRAATYGKGIRILRQEPFETLISFIISQRKNIPAIKSCIEKICINYGDKNEFEGTEYYSFPTPEILANADLDALRDLGVGYRDEYIVGAARAVVDGDIQLDELKEYTNEEAVKVLKGLYGVGDKVANCVSLFGLHHIEAFPIDVWIERIVSEHYNGYFNISKYDGYAGIVQQYMFYYIRNYY